MLVFKVCFLAVYYLAPLGPLPPGQPAPAVAKEHCDVFLAEKMTDEVLDQMLVEAAERYDADETPIVGAPVCLGRLWAGGAGRRGVGRPKEGPDGRL